ncbi:uncharacterized protein LOC131158606 [Malania oleifera]|uniref:uncharacterized protein LOC131158606 n=1 Tax=Malania oleifera TaxID=397392 RepID=UPI0025AEB361|nr:uncharacterized protein LOC131158606 [Malania oleifera]
MPVAQPGQNNGAQGSGSTQQNVPCRSGRVKHQPDWHMFLGESSDRIPDELDTEPDLRAISQVPSDLSQDSFVDRTSGRLWLSQRGFLENQCKLSIAWYPRMDGDAWDMSKVLYASAMECFSRKQSHPSVVRFVNADYAEGFNDRRFTIGHMFTVVRRPICWKSKVQSPVVISTIELGFLVEPEATTDKFKFFLDMVFVSSC